MTIVASSRRGLCISGCPSDADPVDRTEPRADQDADSSSEHRHEIRAADVRRWAPGELDAEPHAQSEDATERRVGLLLLQPHFERSGLGNDYSVAGRRDDSRPADPPVERTARDGRLATPSPTPNAHDGAIGNLRRQRWPIAEGRARASPDEGDHACQYERMEPKHWSSTRVTGTSMFGGDGGHSIRGVT